MSHTGREPLLLGENAPKKRCRVQALRAQSLSGPRPRPRLQERTAGAHLLNREITDVCVHARHMCLSSRVAHAGNYFVSWQTVLTYVG